MLVALGLDEVLGRLRRFAYGEPKVGGRDVILEPADNKQARTARLFEVTLPETPPAEKPEVDLTPRAAAQVAKKGAQPRNTITRALQIQQTLAEIEQRKKDDEKWKRPKMVDDLPQLRRYLKKQYGSLASAWTHGLDLDSNERVTFSEFSIAMRNNYFKGDIKAVFNELDKDGNGYITMDEWDVETYEVLKTFDEMVLSNYGSFWEAWKAFDDDGNGHLTEKEFLSRCNSLGYRGNARKLFKYLLPNAHQKYVTLPDFAPQAFNQSLIDPESLSTLSNKEKTEKAIQDVKDLRMERFDLAALKKLLVNKYGSLAAAWKYGLDLDRNGKITYNEFSRAVREIGFHGNIKAIWKELNTDESNDISLEELDPAAHKHLSQFEAHVHGKHGSYLEAWQALGVNPGTRIHKKQFQEMCAQLDYTGDVDELFKHLLTKPAVPSFSLSELDPRVLQESYMNPERLNPVSRKEKVEAWRKESLAKDMGASDYKAVRTILLNQYGTIACAWRHLLDVDGNGKISFVEFGNAMRRIGYKGKIKDLWLQLEKDGNGYITMDELDPKAHKALTAFRELVLSQYSNWLEAWEFFDHKKARRLNEVQFVERCETLGYQGDANELYRYFLDHPSCEFVTLADLDKEAAREAGFDPERFNTLLKKQEYEAAQEEQKRQQANKLAEDVPSLMKILLKRFGTITAAWAQALDLQGNGRISLMEFLRAMQELNLRGNMRKLFKALDQDGNGSLTLGELDPGAHEAITRFEEFVHEKHGSMIDAFRAMDIGKKGRLYGADFVEMMTKNGFEGDSEQLFRYLCVKPNQSWITLDDLDADAAYEAKVEVQEAKRGKDLGDKDFEALKATLVRLYGTMPAAWKHRLDPGNNGFIGFVHFCNACRKVGFQGSPREVWARLQKDSKGRVTLQAFDAKAFEALEAFKALTLQKHGSWLKAWEVIDKNKSGAVDEEEFAVTCTDIGYKDDAVKLFKYLLDEPCCNKLQLEDLDLAAAQELRLDPARLDEGGVAKKEALELEELRKKNEWKQLADLPSLKNLLKLRYGTIASAWKHCLDRNGDGQISYMEFCRALREVSYRGAVRELWHELDKDQNGQISLGEFEPEAHQVLQDFHSFILEKCGSFPEALRSHFDVAAKGRLDEASFKQKCLSLGYQGDVDLLWQHLLEKPLENRHWIIPEDIEPHHLKKRGREVQRELKMNLAKEGLYHSPIRGGSAEKNISAAPTPAAELESDKTGSDKNEQTGNQSSALLPEAENSPEEPSQILPEAEQDNLEGLVGAPASEEAPDNKQSGPDVSAAKPSHEDSYKDEFEDADSDLGNGVSAVGADLQEDSYFEKEFEESKDENAEEDAEYDDEFEDEDAS